MIFGDNNISLVVFAGGPSTPAETIQRFWKVICPDESVWIDIPRNIVETEACNDGN